MAKAKTVTLNLAALSAIVIGMNSEQGFVYASKADYEPLVAAGLVEVNAEFKNEAGDLAARATEAGVAKYNELTANTEHTPEVYTEDDTTDQVADVPKSKPLFTIVDNVPVPEVRSRGGNKPSLYPFDALTIGQSFFVAGKTAKQIASTVTGANERYSHVDPSGATRPKRGGEGTVPVRIQDRKFIYKNVDGAGWGKTGVSGVAIWRVDVV